MDEKTAACSPVVTDDPVAAAMEMEDTAVMAHMGKKPQLKRRFNFTTILALSATLLQSWEALGSTLGGGLTAGGPVALIWGYLFVFSGSLALAASIAEMASMCPISGAQYHWTFMFAPRAVRVPVSFIQGWVTCFAWQAVLTSFTYLLAAQVQGLVVLNVPGYVGARWHTTLLMWALLAAAYAVNMWAVWLLPGAELVAGAAHVLAFVAFVVAMLVLAHARGAGADFVFAGTANDTGWSNGGVAFFLGLLPGVWSLSGFDGAIHLSEETHHAARVVPKVIVWTVVLNGVLAFLFALAALFSITDVAAAVGTPTGYPLIEIFRQATGSRAAATFMEAVILAIGMAGNLAVVASVTRLTWAFARDKGLPFSDFFAHVDPHSRVPTRCIHLVSAVFFALSLINFGSTVAFTALVSLATISIYVSYIIPIVCLLTKRLRREAIEFGPFALGRLGAVVNTYAVAYGCLMIPFMALPTVRPVTASSMNYAGPVFAVVLVLAGLDYVVRGRRRFKGPTREVGL